MSDRQLVIGIFADEPAADVAAAKLKDSGVADGDAMGILVLDDKGKLKEGKIGARSTRKGAGVGAVLTLLGPMGMIAGAAGGAAVGALHHKGLGLTDGDKARLASELEAGKAAVGVLASWEDGPTISSTLTQLGGVSEAHAVTDEGLEAAAAATATS